MSDEGYSVEDGGTPPPDPAPAPVAEAPAPEPPAADPPAHAPDVEVDGQRMVPLAALSAVREELRTVKQKADKFDEVNGWYQQKKAVVDFLEAHPDLMAPRPAPAAPAPAPPEQDEALVQLARTLDLYTPEGQPDAKRAATIRNLVKSEAQTIAQEAVKPFQEMSVTQQAQANLRDAMAATLPNGLKPNPAVLQTIWKQAGPKVMADPQAAAAAVMLAAGFGVAQQAPAPAAPPAAPVVSEPAGRVATTRAPMSEFEQRVIGIRGITPQKYQEYTSGFKAGSINALED